MLLAMVMGNNKSATKTNAGESSGIFDCHTDVAVRCGAHCPIPIEHVQGISWSHWMPPSGECLRHIAPAAVMVDEFVETTLNTNKTQLLPSNYSTFDR